ncbi:MAG: 1,4-dihydroxy-2-naphthoate octaprenyltransferase [Prevotella sp.]|nr:1,4-dihydroxy-2-naphthoate octaprenyltransferase [Prevotella sp.]
MEEEVRLNSPRAWLLAARPKTLSGAAVPVMVALSMAWCDLSGTGFKVLPAILCLLFAFIMQIDANLVNDYFDFRKGTDDEQRLGPKRACAQGWVTLSAMRKAIALTTAAACAVGIPLVLYGGWWMVAIGVLCVVFCFLYTTHLSYLGLGDVLVLLFFGIVPVGATYFLQTGRMTLEVFTASVACGLVIDTLLVVNNYRDRDNDRRTGKNTLVVRIGARATERLFPALGIIACLLGLVYWAYGHFWAFLLPVVYLSLHLVTSERMKTIGKGFGLNKILGENARNMFIYGILLSIGFLLG